MKRMGEDAGVCGIPTTLKDKGRGEGANLEGWPSGGEAGMCVEVVGGVGADHEGLALGDGRKEALEGVDPCR